MIAPRCDHSIPASFPKTKSRPCEQRYIADLGLLLSWPPKTTWQGLALIPCIDQNRRAHWQRPIKKLGRHRPGLDNWEGACEVLRLCATGPDLSIRVNPKVALIASSRHCIAMLFASVMAFRGGDSFLGLRHLSGNDQVDSW